MHDTITNRPHLIPALNAAVAAYDRGTSKHCVRVGHNSRLLGSSLGVEGQDLEALGWAGVLHDLGKLAVPDEMLRKPGPLSDDEWIEVKRHPVVGAELVLSLSPELAPIAEGIRTHHERWDGTGYPDGLRDEAIPLPGRIIAVVDVFDSLTHPRGYRSHVRSQPDATEFVEQAVGSQFDPRIVPRFLELLRRGQLSTR
jgi:putative two-component system response regulator